VILVFYLGTECAHCIEQLHKLAAKKADWEASDTVLLGVSSAPPEKNAAALKSMGDLPIRLLSDKSFANAHRFHSYDDFEDIELHSTILIDKLGRVYWAQTGGNPFSDMEFLSKQITRMNQLASASREGSAGTLPKAGL
jgi:peroxiredoxin